MFVYRFDSRILTAGGRGGQLFEQDAKKRKPKLPFPDPIPNNLI